jgi:hypothetical protein
LTAVAVELRGRRVRLGSRYRPGKGTPAAASGAVHREDEVLLLDEEGEMPIKAVDSRTASFLSELSGPKLADRFLERLGPGGETSLAKLVLDGVVELERGGEFVHGIHALPLGRGAEGLLSQVDDLSRQVLRYGAATAGGDPLALSLRMYKAHSIPLSRRWLEALPTPEAVSGYLDVEGAVGRLGPDWQEGVDPDGNWRIWRRRERWSGSPFKLYVSPQPGSLPAALRAVAGAAQRHAAIAFKVGATPHGVLRPDKLVVYFAEREALAAAAGEIDGELEGRRAHGVPFTAAIAGDGLLSWGADPPGEAVGGASWLGGSWRRWLTDRLAAAITAARRQRAGVEEAAEFALARLRLDGVDPSAWTLADTRAAGWAG